MSSDYLLIAIEASIAMLLINAAAFYVSRRGLVTKVLLITSPIVATSFGLGILFADSGVTTSSSIIFFAVSVTAGFLFTWAVYRWLVRPINLVATVSTRIAEGDLAQQVQIGSKDEVGHMVRSIQEMIGYLQQMAETAERIADGDLRIEAAPRSERDMLGHSFSKMIATLKQLTSQLDQGTLGLAAASSQLSSVANESSSAVSQVAATIQQISEGAQLQSESVRRTAVSTEEMSRAIDGIAAGAQRQSSAISRTSSITTQIADALAHVSERVKSSSKIALAAGESAQEGVQTVAETIQGMERIKDAFGQLVQQIQQMGQQSQQIGTIVSTINDIAAETNVLALNAAIEAARAGQHGKGFTVVAGEVQKLAKRTSVEAKSIANLLESMQMTVGRAEKVMSDGAVIVDEGTSHAGEAREALADILSSTETVSRHFQDVAATIQQLSASSTDLTQAMSTVASVVNENTVAVSQMNISSDDVTESIKRIATVSEENSSAVLQVNSAAIQMNSQVHDVTNLVASLSDMAQQQRALISQFKLEEPVVPGGNGAADK